MSPLKGTTGRMGLIDRYLAGQEVEVWEEIYEMTRTPEAIAEVDLVAAETMRRVRFDLVTLVDRLRTEGFRFHAPAEALAPPSPRVEVLLSELDAKVATIAADGFPGLPLAPSVRAFYRVVGAVNLTGVSSLWHAPQARDPDYDAEHFLGDGLVVMPIDDLVLAVDEIPAGTASLPFSPDIFHKDDISGGPPYGFDVVSPSLDAFCTEVQLAFVPYLRWCILEWGGFPGLRHYANAPTGWLDALRDGLARF